jgi:aryl-alcohol dehydrogenase-like predicted oxidoreductase
MAVPAAFWAASQLGHAGLLFAEPTAAPAKGKLITRQLGKTGIQIPVVSMGDPSEDAPGIIRRAYESGIRYFDTAADYQEGKNEILLGTGLKALNARKDVVIGTKVLASQQRTGLNSDQAGKLFLEIFEKSLKNLQTDYIDVLYFHQVDDPKDVSMEGPLKVMQDLKKQGKVRAIGVSMHTAEPVLAEVVRLGVHDAVLFPFNLSIGADPKLMAAMDAAHKKGIGIIAMKTTAGNMGAPGGGGGAAGGGGAPGGPGGAGAQAGGPGGAGGGAPSGGGGGARRETVVTGVTRTALLKWVLQHESVTSLISAFGTYDHLEQNMAVAYDLAFTDEEKKIISDKKLTASLEFCHQCRQCVGTCPQGADIPTLMRTHMYAMNYYPGTGHPHLALASIPAGRGLEACANCTTCSASCAWHVDIPRKIAQLQGWRQSV